MIVGILSDIHGDTPSLAKAMGLLKKNGAEKLICLGDLTGYGRDPSGVLEMVAAYCRIILMGNHDQAVSGSGILDYYNDNAKKHILKHRKLIGEHGMKWLSSLPFQSKIENLQLVHASIPDPHFWRYPATEKRQLKYKEFISPLKIFNAMETPFLIKGHTHNPGMTVKMKSGETRLFSNPPEQWVSFSNAEKVIIDVGSVSMPRGNARKRSCLLFDLENHSFKYIFFDV